MFGGHYRSKLMNRLMFGRYNSRIVDVQTPNDWICSQRDVVDKYNATPECSFIFTADGIQALMRTLNYIEDKDNIRHIPKNLPIFIASGKDDPVGDYGRAVRQVYDTFKHEGISDVTLKLYDGCRHELHNEAVKDELFDAIYGWMCDRMNR